MPFSEHFGNHYCIPSLLESHFSRYNVQVESIVPGKYHFSQYPCWKQITGEDQLKFKEHGTHMNIQHEQRKPTMDTWGL